MNQIRLDFQQTKNSSVWRLIGVGLFVFAMTLSLLLMIRNQQNVDKANQFLNDINHIKHPVLSVFKPKNEAQDELLKKQLNQAEAVTMQLNLPWPSLFRALEDTIGKDINLLSVTPNAQIGEVLIVGQTDNLPIVFAYIQRLRESKIFSRVELNDHQRVMHNGVQALRFNITAKWLIQHG